jgi:hypothetical protein
LYNILEEQVLKQFNKKDFTYDDGIEIPSCFKNLWAPSRHSGDSSLSPKEPSNSLTWKAIKRRHVHEQVVINIQNDMPNRLTTK